VIKPVGIVGTGAVSCAGNNLQEIWSSLKNRKSGIQSTGLGPVQNFEHLATQFPRLKDSRAAVFAAHALKESVEAAGWKDWEKDTAIVLATTAGQITLWENEVPQFVSGKIAAGQFALAIRNQSLGSMCEALQDEFGLKGQSFLITSACSASGQALALGAQLIRQRKARRVLVGGFETLSRLTVEGFRSLKLISPQIAKPFDRDRDGINLSEGAAFVALEDTLDAAAFVLGHGLTADAFHMTAPSNDGEGIMRAMRLSLEMSGLKTSDVDWIHGHGTGSLANDLAEGTAVRNLFGVDHPPVSSTKWLHGHLLGGSGLLETVLSVQALREGEAIPSLGLENPDPAIPLKWQPPQGELKYIVKTTLGFGGSNSAVVLKKGRP
jgi:3-oxoacyl-[acyl-carrier-protein] synthase II